MCASPANGRPRDAASDWDDDDEWEDTGVGWDEDDDDGAAPAGHERGGDAADPGELPPRRPWAPRDPRRARLRDVDGRMPSDSADDLHAWDEDDDAGEAAAHAPDPFAVDYDPDDPNDDVLDAAEAELEPLLRLPLPLPRRFRRRMGPSALRLYAYIAWSTHRNVGTARRLTRWTFWRLPAAALVVLSPVVLMDPRLSDIGWAIASIVTLVFATAAMGGLATAPSPFARWLFNIGRRGLLEELYMARVNAHDIVTAHLHARIPPLATFMLTIGSLIGMMCAMHDFTTPNPSGELMSLQVVVTALLTMWALLEFLQVVAVKRGRVGSGAVIASMFSATWIAIFLAIGSFILAAVVCGFVRELSWVQPPPDKWSALQTPWLAAWCLTYPLVWFPVLSIGTALLTARTATTPKLRDLSIVWDDVVSKTLAVAEESR